MPFRAIGERLDRDSIQCPGPLKAALRAGKHGRKLVPQPYRLVDDAEKLFHQGFPLALQKLQPLAYDFAAPSEGQKLLPRRRALFKYRHIIFSLRPPFRERTSEAQALNRAFRLSSDRPHPAPRTSSRTRRQRQGIFCRGLTSPPRRLS